MVLKGMGLVSRTVLDWPDERPAPTGGVGGKAIYTSESAYQNVVNNCPQTYAGRSALGQELYNDLKFRDNQSDRFTYSLPGGGSGTFRYDFDNGNCVIVPFKPLKIQKGGTIYPEDGITTFTITDENGIVYTFDRAEKTQFYSCVNCYNGEANIAWYLTKISTPDGGDNIEYQYKTNVKNKFTTTNYSHTVSHGVLQPGTAVGLPSSEYIFTDGTRGDQSNQAVTTFEPILEKIISATTIVEFNYANDRVDWVDGKYRLISIKVYNKANNSLVKEISLNNNAYFGTSSNNKRLKLNSVSFKGTDGQSVENYSFGYEGGELPPYSSFNQDFWGYYNGANNSGLVPAEIDQPVPTVNSAYYWGVRTPNYNYAKVCMLNEITYPTGGRTVFEYEPNTAPGIIGNSTYAGGFRINTITNYSTATVSKKKYTYAQPYFPHYLAELFSNNLIYDRDYSMCSSIIGSSPVRTIVQSSSTTSLAFSNGAPVIYGIVTEYDGDLTTNNGKTEYVYMPPDEFRPEPWKATYGTFCYDNGAYESKLISKTVFKKSGSSYIPVSEELNTYTKLRDNEFSTGAHVMKTSYDLSGTDSHYDFGYQFGSCCSGCLPQYINYFSYVDSKAQEKVFLLTQTIEKQFKPDGSEGINNITQLWYSNPNHLFLTEKTKISSKGEAFKTYYQYPQDNPSDPINYYLIQAHILSPLREIQDYKTTNFLRSSKTNYNSFTGTSLNMLLPSSVESKVGSNNSETRLQFHNYDVNGNLLDVSKANDVHEVYLYGYNAMYPVAKVVGSDYYTVEGFIDQTILNNATGQYTDQQIRTELNKIRTGLISAKAQVTTYTYKPLIGMTSQTDPNGRTTYYEYDAFGRLSFVRDQDNNIIKRYCYNYQGQSEACGIATVYTNAVQTGTFTKQCTVGTGSSVTYTVTAGTYSATNPNDADNQALADIAANGQAYADAHGICIPPPPPSTGTVYARVELDQDAIGSSQSGGENDSIEEVIQTAEATIHFYSDAACTQPTTLSQSVSVTVSLPNVVKDNTNTIYATGDIPILADEIIPANTSTYWITSLSIYYEENLYSYYIPTFTRRESYTFSLSNGAGGDTTFVVKPVYFHFTPYYLYHY